MTSVLGLIFVLQHSAIVIPTLGVQELKVRQAGQRRRLQRPAPTLGARQRQQTQNCKPP